MFKYCSVYIDKIWSYEDEENLLFLKSNWIPHLGKDMSYEESSWIRFMIYNFLILFLFIFYKFCNFIFEVYIVSPLCLSGTAKR